MGLCLLASGCLSYRTGGLPDAAPSKRETPASARPAAYFAVTCQTRMCAESEVHENVAAAQAFRGTLARVLDESGAFGSYTFAASRGTNADLRIVLALKSEETASVFAIALSAATLTVIPATGTETHRLTVHVFDRSGKERGMYGVEDSMRTWFELLLCPLGSWRSPVKVQKGLMENLVRTVLARMDADGLLNRAGRVGEARVSPSKD